MSFIRQETLTEKHKKTSGLAVPGNVVLHVVKLWCQIRPANLPYMTGKSFLALYRSTSQFTKSCDLPMSFQGPVYRSDFVTLLSSSAVLKTFFFSGRPHDAPCMLYHVIVDIIYVILYAQMCIHMYGDMCMHKCTHACTHKHVRVYTQWHTPCTHTHTHTHTRTHRALDTLTHTPFLSIIFTLPCSSNFRFDINYSLNVT